MLDTGFMIHDKPVALELLNGYLYAFASPGFSWKDYQPNLKGQPKTQSSNTTITFNHVAEVQHRELV